MMDETGTASGTTSGRVWKQAVLLLEENEGNALAAWLAARELHMMAQPMDFGFPDGPRLAVSVAIGEWMEQHHPEALQVCTTAVRDAVPGADLCEPRFHAQQASGARVMVMVDVITAEGALNA